MKFSIQSLLSIVSLLVLLLQIVEMAPIDDDSSELSSDSLGDDESPRVNPQSEAISYEEEDKEDATGTTVEVSNKDIGEGPSKLFGNLFGTLKNREHIKEEEFTEILQHTSGLFLSPIASVFRLFGLR
jgi:hypothetical protein